MKQLVDFQRSHGGPPTRTKPPVITKFLQSRNLSPLTCLSTVKPINTLNSQSQSLQRSALRFCSQPDHQRVQAHAFRHALHSLIATVLAKQSFLRSFPQDSSPDQGLEERMPLKSHASRSPSTPFGPSEIGTCSVADSATNSTSVQVL